MNKKLGRFLQPRIGAYFFVLFCFAAAAIAGQYYILAAIEFGVTAVLLAGHIVYRNYRRRELSRFLQKTSDEMSKREGTDSPFPVVVIRLDDGGIVYANDRFVNITGF